MQKQKIVIDPGSTNLTIIGSGFIKRVPNACVIKRGNHMELVAVGKDAIKMSSLPEHCSLVYPVREGVVVRPDVFAKLLEHYLDELITINLFNPVELYVLIPCGLSSAERENMEYAIQKTGFKDITLIESMLGLLPILGGMDRAVCLLGGGTTEVGVINEEGILSGCTLGVGGNTINEKIVDQILKSYNLRISASTAEKLKLEIGSLQDKDLSVLTVTGQDILDGQIKNVEISAESLRAPISWCFKKIAELIESVLTTIPYGRLATISANGLYVAGAGAQLRGLAEYLTRYLKLPVIVSLEPETEVIKGAYSLITDQSGKYKAILGNKR